VAAFPISKEFGCQIIFICDASAMPRQAAKNESLKDFPEFPVKREVICSMFTPPLPKSTFYDRVNEGKIIPMPKLSGYYLLNASLHRLGLPLAKELPAKVGARSFGRLVEQAQRIGDDHVAADQLTAVTDWIAPPTREVSGSASSAKSAGRLMPTWMSGWPVRSPTSCASRSFGRAAQTRNFGLSARSRTCSAGDSSMIRPHAWDVVPYPGIQEGRGNGMGRWRFP
jgi:hypothetical protein